jgi:cobalt-zinc-cadmium efflux system membrane fusion protein
MYTTVQVSVDQRQAIAIPRNAILRLGEQSIVFVQTGLAPDGRLKFERRPIAVDEETGGDYLPVKQGVAAGEQIVSSGGTLLLGMI